MGQPVNLSNELVDDARAVSHFSQRSIAGQIEFWAGFGKSIEPLLRGDRALSLLMAGGERPLSQPLSEVETAKGCKRPKSSLNKRHYPHYRQVPDPPDLICSIGEDARKTVGRFVGREFNAVKVDCFL